MKFLLIKAPFKTIVSILRNKIKTNYILMRKLSLKILKDNLQDNFAFQFLKDNLS